MKAFRDMEFIAFRRKPTLVDEHRVLISLLASCKKHLSVRPFLPNFTLKNRAVFVRTRLPADQVLIDSDVVPF